MMNKRSVAKCVLRRIFTHEFNLPFCLGELKKFTPKWIFTEITYS
jgi:hypothetical protein